MWLNEIKAGLTSRQLSAVSGDNPSEQVLCGGGLSQLQGLLFISYVCTCLAQPADLCGSFQSYSDFCGSLHPLLPPGW